MPQKSSYMENQTMYEIEQPKAQRPEGIIPSEDIKVWGCMKLQQEYTWSQTDEGRQNAASKFSEQHCRQKMGSPVDALMPKLDLFEGNKDAFSFLKSSVSPFLTDADKMSDDLLKGKADADKVSLADDFELAAGKKGHGRKSRGSSYTEADRQKEINGILRAYPTTGMHW
jgi:hypothetical protein